MVTFKRNQSLLVYFHQWTNRFKVFLGVLQPGCLIASNNVDDLFIGLTQVARWLFRCNTLSLFFKILSFSMALNSQRSLIVLTCEIIDYCEKDSYGFSVRDAKIYTVLFCHNVSFVHIRSPSLRTTSCISIYRCIIIMQKSTFPFYWHHHVISKERWTVKKKQLRFRRKLYIVIIIQGTWKRFFLYMFLSKALFSKTLV